MDVYQATWSITHRTISTTITKHQSWKLYVPWSTTQIGSTTRESVNNQNLIFIWCHSFDGFCFVSSFRIALRQLSASDDDVNEAVSRFKENGFINYYGHQRFGNHASVPTHQIGLFLVQGNFKQVISQPFYPKCDLWVDIYTRFVLL